MMTRQNICWRKVDQSGPILLDSTVAQDWSKQPMVSFVSGYTRSV
jgi:hypothetical protein